MVRITLGPLSGVIHLHQEPGAARAHTRGVPNGHHYDPHHHHDAAEDDPTLAPDAGDLSDAVSGAVGGGAVACAMHQTPRKPHAAGHQIHGAAAVEGDGDADTVSHPYHLWYVTRHDLEVFRRHAEHDVPLPGAGAWARMMDKEIPGLLRYSAWRRALPSGITEYRSETILPDLSPLEYVDFSLDDDARCKWESFMVSAEVLEQGDHAQRQQVVRWVRSFPFGFITDREYVLARRLFSITPDGEVHAGLPHSSRRATHGSAAHDDLPVADLYAVTKNIHHPGADHSDDKKVIDIEDYYSMWRCRSVPCPWNSGRPACEVVLLHSENMKISERLAKFAISMGMSKFVTLMAEAVPGFVQERRQRYSPQELDPLTYSCRMPILPHTASPAAAARAQHEAEEAQVASPKTPSLSRAAPYDSARSAREVPYSPVSSGVGVGLAPSSSGLWSISASPQFSGHLTAAAGAAGRYSLTDVAVSGVGHAAHAHGRLDLSPSGAEPYDPAAAANGPPKPAGPEQGAAAGASGRRASGALGRAMTASGLWRRGEMPEDVSSAWGSAPPPRRKRRGALLSLARNAALVLIIGLAGRRVVAAAAARAGAGEPGRRRRGVTSGDSDDD